MEVNSLSISVDEFVLSLAAQETYFYFQEKRSFFTFGLFSFRCDHTVRKLSIADFLTSREVETRGAFSSNSLVTSVN